MSDSLQPNEPEHGGPPCPSPTPGAYPNSCPLNQWCHLSISSSIVPFSSCLKSFPTSGLFKWVSSSHHVAKILEFSFNISPSNEHPGLISFRMDWLDLLAVQGTLKSLLQHHSSKASILQHSFFFVVQLSHPYMTTGKTIALTRPSPRKRNAKKQNGCLRRPYKSCEKKRSKKQRRKGKIYPFECRVPRNSKKR